MQTSSKILVAGAGLFALPIPGTFVGGALVMLGGAAARLAGK
jgi:hypothetical protein